MNKVEIQYYISKAEKILSNETLKLFKYIVNLEDNGRTLSKEEYCKVTNTCGYYYNLSLEELERNGFLKIVNNVAVFNICGNS